MKKLIIGTLICLSSVSFASTCPQLYPNEKELAPANTVELCNSFFVSRYDPNNKAVVLTSEVLRKISPVGMAERVNAFRPDARVKKGPTNSDYVKSEYDRGHMVPAGDSATSSQMRETFLLTNVTPQDSVLNRGQWKSLENRIRTLFNKGTADMHVVTIAIYKSPSIRIGSGIPVPISYWKIVYYGNHKLYYFADNKPYARIQLISTVNVDRLITNATNF